MDRVIVTGLNKYFPRLGAAIHSGAVPESAAGGTCQFPKDVQTPTAPQDAGSATTARRPRVSLAVSAEVVWLWDTHEFDTAEIAAALRIPEAEVASIIHFIREERRARR